MNALKRTLIGSMLVLPILTGPAFGDTFGFDFQKIYETNGPVSLEMETVRGNISIERTDSDKLIIEATKIIHAADRENAEEVADHVEIKVDRQGNSFSIKTNYLVMFNRSRSFWNRVLGVGDDSFGDVNFKIQLPDDCDIKITSHYGDILVENNEGPVEIVNSGPGHISVAYCTGHVTVQQPQADIDLDWIEGDIRVKSESGRIHAIQLEGSIDISTLSALVDVKTELLSNNSYLIETTTGKISFSVPESSSGSLKIDTRSGEIKTDVPIAVTSMARNSLEGDFGGGGVRIVLTSSTGDVEIAQY